MASPPSVPHAPHSPHAPEQLRPEPPRLARRACWLALIGAPFLALCVLAMVQIATDTYPRSDATLNALANAPVPVRSVGVMARWNTCVRHRLHRRLEWFWPVQWSTVDRILTACEHEVNDPTVTARMPALRASVAPFWTGGAFDPEDVQDARSMPPLKP